MTNTGLGPALREVDALLRNGAVGGLTDAELLDRFAGRGGEAAERAFAALVDRHGPMVHRACRAALGDPDEADDAAQAVFLVLARRAGSIRDREALAGWLLGTARRVASVARSAAARRRRHESKAAEAAPRSAEAAEVADDLGPALREELGRLPARYLAPIVLCHLEGLTHDQAARRLGWPVGTVRSRLARGRDRLRGRLVRRGLAPSAGLIAARLAEGPSSAATPADLESIVRASARFLAGESATAGAMSARAADLAGVVLGAMTMTKVKIVASLALISGVLATGVAVVAQSGAARPGAAPGPDGVRRVDPVPTDATIRAALDATLDMDFPKAISLEDVLKSVRAKTESPGLKAGIPIYVDPVGLRSAGRTMSSPVAAVPRGPVPLKASLGDALRGLGLAFDVADGLMTISSESTIFDRRLDRLEVKLDRALAAGPALAARPALVADPAASRSRPPASLLEAKVVACRAAFDATKRYFEEKPGLDLDSIYLWSRRLMQAEIDRDGRESAGPARAHLGRMKDLETRIETDFQAGRGTDLNSRAAAYYRRDAEAIVATYGGPQAGDTQPRPKD